MNNNQTKKQQADDLTKSIPVDQIHPHSEQDTGIRDDETFKRLVENIASRGLINPIVVRESNGGYELITGHHRWNAVKKLEWNTIPTKVIQIDDNESAEMCLADNMVHSKYDPIQLEEKVYLRWKNGNYESYSELSKKIGITPEWTSNLIKAHELRLKVQEKRDDLNISDFTPQSILNASLIMQGKTDDIAFRDFYSFIGVCIKKKYKTTKIEKVAKDLNLWSEENRESVLYDGVSYGKLKQDMNTQAKRDTPSGRRRKTSSTEIANKDFAIGTYIALDKHLLNVIVNIEDADDKAESLRYAKMSMALYAEVLQGFQQITKEQHKHIKENILGIKIPVRKYDGNIDLQKLGAFLDSTEDEDSKVSSDSDSPKPQED